MSDNTSGDAPFKNAIDDYFTSIKNDDSVSKAVPFVMGGDPDMKQTFDIAVALYAKGVRMMEIGIPFSDPSADGPVIQAAGLRAIKNNVTLTDIFACVVQIKIACPDMAIILMGYYNPVRAFGEKKFAEECASSGVAGVIIVDLPPEHDHGLRPHLIASRIHFIRLIAPNTTKNRLQYLLSIASGCVYQVAIAGVTGAKSAIYEDIQKAVTRVRTFSDIPVITGFGVRTGDDVRRLTQSADAAVIGSALVDAIAQSRGSDAGEAAARFWDGLN